MIRLKPAEYDRAEPLFRLLDDHLAVQAILNGVVPAPVLVAVAGHPSQPQVALTWTGHRYYLAGSPQDDACSEALRHLFASTIYPRAQEAGHKISVLYYAPATWEPVLEGILGDKLTSRAQRQLYAITAPKHDWRTVLPGGYILRPVDRNLLHDMRLRNLDLLAKEICAERPSVADFLDRGFGICGVHGDEIVGWCLSEYNTPSRCEVGIETLVAHRRRGLATAMASALVEQALSRGMRQVNWHCYTRNTASVATALSAGFVKVRDYSVIVVRFGES